MVQSKIILSTQLKHDNVIKLIQQKYKLKGDRTFLVQRARDIRADIYNMTINIEKLENQIDNYVVKNFEKK